MSMLQPPLVRLWTRPDLGWTSYPVVADGLVVVATAGSAPGATIVALDAETGETDWSVPLGGPLNWYRWGGVAYEDGRIYALNYDGVLRGLDAATGTELWATKLQQRSFTSPPTARDGIVYTAGAGSGGTPSAVAGATGTVLWTQRVANGDDSSPAVDEANVYVSYACTNVYAFQRLTGVQVWRHRTDCDGGGGRTPAVWGGRVFVRDNEDWPTLALSILDGTTVEEIPTKTIPVFSGTTMITRPDGVLHGSSDLPLVTDWDFYGDGRLSSAPLVANGIAYVGSSTGKVFGVDVETGALRWQGDAGAPVPWPNHQSTQPLTGLGAGQGLLVVPTTAGVTAFGEAPGPLPTPTPTVTALPTLTPIATPTVIETPIATPTPMATPTASDTPTPVNTP